MSVIDRINGLNQGVAYKAPVRVATTANITLSGTQTIDGVAVAADDRVLVKNQTDTTENGIYIVSATAWARSGDFDGSRDVTRGTLIQVLDGSVNSEKTFRLTTAANPVSFGSSAITFALHPSIGTPSSWEGQWLTATIYGVNDLVYNRGKTYIAILEHTSGASTEPGVGASWETNWDLVADGVTWEGDWVTATAYATNAIVFNGVSSFICILAHTSGASTEPGVGASWETYWQYLAKGASISGIPDADQVPYDNASSGLAATDVQAAIDELDATLDAGFELSNDTSPQLGGDLDTNGNMVKYTKGADIASANALPLVTDGNYFDVTGTTAITSIDTSGKVGTVIKLHFDGALTLTHHATDLILPGAANITTAAGDEAEFVEYASGDWRCTHYTKASGQSIVGGLSASDITGLAEVVIVAGDTILLSDSSDSGNLKRDTVQGILDLVVPPTTLHAVGTYILAQGTVNTAEGATLSGSSLSKAAANSSDGTWTVLSDTIPGTWRNMGGEVVAAEDNITLWARTV